MLIAVMACWRNYDSVEAIRATWGKDSPIEIRFFFGQGANRAAFADEVFLNVPDDYKHIANKVEAMIHWVHSKNYDFVFKCDDDVYLVPSRLLKSNEHRDYCGNWNDKGYIWGYSHWLSKKAIDILVKSELNNISDDWWISQTLIKNGIEPFHDPRFILSRRVLGDKFPDIPRQNNNIILSAEFGPKELYTVHKRFLKQEDITDNMSSEEYKKYIENSLRQRA